MNNIDRNFEKLNAGLDQLGYKDLTTCEDKKSAIELISASLQEMKDTIIKDDFESIQDEINFFKIIKPSVTSRFMLLSFAIQYESQRIMSKELVEEWLQDRVIKRNHFLQEYRTYLLQLNELTSEQEERYFVRNRFTPPMNDVFQKVLLYPTFCTFHSEILSTSKAYKLIHDYLERVDNLADNKPDYSYELKWTQKKTALIELMYSLYYSKAINNGQCNINDLKDFFEKAFNIRLGNVYRTFYDIKNREERTLFLDSLRIVIENKLDEDDAFTPN